MSFPVSQSCWAPLGSDYQEANPWFPAPGAAALGSRPGIVSFITFQRASQPVNVCTGRSKYPAISTELLSFCREWQVSSERALAFKGNLQVSTKALISILCANNNICSPFSMCAHKRLVEDVWLFKTLWWLELVYQFKGTHLIFFLKFEIAYEGFYPRRLTVHTPRAHVGNDRQKGRN